MEKSNVGSWALTISTETRVGMVHPGAVEYFGTKGNTARFRQYDRTFPYHSFISFGFDYQCQALSEEKSICFERYNPIPFLLLKRKKILDESTTVYGEFSQKLALKW